MEHTETLIMPRQNRLSREYVASLEAVRFSGQIITVSTQHMFIEACKELADQPGLGFDTESRPAFKKGVNYPVSLVQLATHKKAFLFQLRNGNLADELVEVFVNESVRKVGIGIRDDLRKLKELKEFEEKAFVDLGEIASEKGIIQFGARALSARYLGRKIVKSAQKTNWARPDLTDKQLNYAATDAWVCLKIYPLLLADTTNYREFEEEVNGEMDE
jgi:ribonuclease D